jgi:hypothetical protein
MPQRGIATTDLDLVMRNGTEVEGGYLIRKRDFQMLDKGLKLLCERARRLVGKRVVTEGKWIVTPVMQLLERDDTPYGGRRCITFRT